MAPLRARCHWEKQDGVPVHPPLFTKVLGRPKKNRRKTPEEVEKDGGKSITRAGVAIHCSVCKKSGHNKKGHAKYMLEQANGTAVIEDENGELDNPAILEHIIPQDTTPAMDPSEQVGSMVYRMAQEARAHVPQPRDNGPLPEESSFVAAARGALPQPRVTTAMSRGRGSGRIAGRGRKRPAEASTSQPTQPENTSARQGSSYRTTPGSAYHLLFGPDKPHQQQQQQGGDLVPDLNEAAPEEMQTTQDAPPAL